MSSEAGLDDLRPARERATLRVGGMCAAVGAVLFGVRILHGDTPGADATASLRFVGERPQYAFVHITAVVAATLTLAGLLGVVGSFRNPLGWALGRLGLASGLVGLAVFAVESTSEGLALPELDRAAGRATADQQADLVRAARAVLAATHGPSLVAVAMLFGVPLMLIGTGLVRDAYPSRLGWAGIVIGAATFLAAVSQYLDPELLPGYLIYGLLASILAQLWVLALAATMLHRDGPARQQQTGSC